MNILDILDVAEGTWRETTRTEFPLFADTPVEKGMPDPKKDRHWMFYTDGNTTHMDVFKPEVITKLFKKVIMKMYAGAYGEKQKPSDELLERLVHDNFAYLYFHEQFHPTLCPDSKKDEKLVDKALYAGIKKAEPRLSEADVLRKVGNVRNAGWDQIIDGGFFFMANYGNSLEQRLGRVIPEQPVGLKELDRMPDGVVPIFDIIEFEVKAEPFPSLFYPLSRAIYGLCFTRTHEMRGVVFNYFRDRILKQMPKHEFDRVIPLALKGFVKELTPNQLEFARVDRLAFETNVDVLFANYDAPAGDAALEALMADLNTILMDKRSRYAAMEGFIQPLARYISLTQEEKRHGTHIGQGGGGPGDSQSSGNQPGGNTEEALQNLSDVLGTEEGNSLLQAVANSGVSGQPGQAQKDRRLIRLAGDEFYKRNAPEIDIKSPNYEAVTVDLGKVTKPVLVSTVHLPVDQVVNLPLDKIAQFQQQTGIGQLFRLSEHEYRYDIYEWREEDQTDYAYQNEGIDLPDNVVFHVDSSGSMGDPNYVGRKSPFDALMHVCYGLLKTLKQAATEMKKEVSVVAANFSNGTELSDAVELVHMYDTPNNDAKRVLTGFQNGGTEYTISKFRELQSKLKPGKTVHIWATDGSILNGDEVFRNIERMVQDPETSFLYFDIGCRSSLGSRIDSLSRMHPNVRYYPDVSVDSIKDKALEVLIQYSF